MSFKHLFAYKGNISNAFFISVQRSSFACVEQTSTTNGSVVSEMNTEDSKSNESSTDTAKPAEFTSRLALLKFADSNDA